MKSHDTAKANIIASEKIERKERWVCAKSFIVGSFLVLEILREYFVLPPEYISQRSPCLIELNAENVAFLIKVFVFYHCVTFSRIIFFPEDFLKPELL